MQNNKKNLDFANEVVTFSYQGKPVRVVVDRECVWYVLSDLLAMSPFPNPKPDLSGQGKVIENFSLISFSGEATAETLIDVWHLGGLTHCKICQFPSAFKAWIVDTMLFDKLSKIRETAK